MPARRETSPASSSSQQLWGLLSLGGGALLGGATAYFGVQTLKAKDDYEASQFRDADARERGVRNRTLANIALGGAVIAVGIGSYLLITAGSFGETHTSQRKLTAARSDAFSPRF